MKPKKLTKETLELLTVLNSTIGLEKYPFGNKELTVKVRKLESEGVIRYDALTSRWGASTNNILNRLL